MPSIYNNNLTPSLWGAQGNTKPLSSSSTANLTIGGSNGQIQYNDNGALNGTAESNYDKTLGMLTIGPVANVNITGGVPGQVLTKDANGNMMWANSGVPNQPQIHFDVPVTGVSQSFAHPNLATFQDSTYAGVFRNGILMPTDAYVINGTVLSINTLLLSGDRVDVLETAAGTVATGNIGNVNLNGDPTTFLDGTGNWQFVQQPTPVGTVAPLNLDGNINNWLRGDGVWSNIPMPTGNIANLDLNGNVVQYLRGDGNWTNIAVPTGNIANTNYDGNAANYLNGQGSWVPVISGGIPGGSNTQLQFNDNGVFGGVPNSSFDGANLTLGSNTNIKLTGGNANSVLLTDGTGNLSWRDVTNYAAVPRMEFQVLSAGAGQSFTNANLAVYPDSTYATVFRNGVLMDPTDYVISGTSITFPIVLEVGESIDIAASASVGTGSGGNGSGGTVSNVATAGSGLGFALTGGPITTTGTISLTTPNATQLRTSLLIGNVANANFTGNGNVVLAGNGAWRSISSVAGNTTEIQYNLNGVLTATNNMRYDTANNTVTFEGITKLLDDVIVEGDIIPFQSNTYNLGNATHRWKDLYLSNNSVILGDTTLSSEGGLKIDGEIAVTAPNNTITIGNIVANTLAGDGSNISNIAIANVVGAGNVAVINLNGNSTQVLAGNGAWVTPSTGTPTAVGNVGEFQVAGAGGVVVASNRYYIGFNGAGAIVSSRDDTGSPYVGVQYNNTAAVSSSIAVGRSRGSKAAPLPVQIGDTIGGITAVSYTGNGAQTFDTITGWVTSTGPAINMRVTSLPTGAGNTPGTSMSFRVTNSANNSNINATFNEDGTFNVPKLVITDGTAVPPTSTSPGIQGQIVTDSSYIYVCIAANMWARSPLTTW